MVREGHYPKFSEMIDHIEKIALEFLNHESFLQDAKDQNRKDWCDLRDLLSGKRSVKEVENETDSEDERPGIKSLKMNKQGSQ